MAKLAALEQEAREELPPVDARGGFRLWTLDQGHVLAFQPEPDLTAHELATLLPVLFVMSKRPTVGLTDWLTATKLSRHWSRTKVESNG